MLDLLVITVIKQAMNRAFIIITENIAGRFDKEWTPASVWSDIGEKAWQTEAIMWLKLTSAVYKEITDKLTTF